MSDETHQHDGPSDGPHAASSPSRRGARAIALAALLASVPACGANATVTSTHEDVSTPVEQYFVGTRRVHTTEDGETERTSSSRVSGSNPSSGPQLAAPAARTTEHSVVAFRLLRPAEHRIIEEVLVGDAAHVEHERWQLDLDATQQRAVYRDAGETQGEGELRGAPWHWTSWHLECRRADRTSVITEATLSARELRRVSRVMGAGGSLLSESVEVLSAVDREEYERARAALVGPSPVQ